MSIRTDDLENVTEGNKNLDPNVYSFQVTKADIMTKDRDGEDYESLMVRAKCTGGPTQKDGSEPEDVEMAMFFPLDHFEGHKDGGNFAKGKRKAFLAATMGEITGEEIDEKDLIGEEFKARIQIRKDQDGDPQMDVKKYLAS